MQGTEGKAVYTGPSMNPTLVEPQLLEIEPYADAASVSPGDVIFFRRTGMAAGIVHRVMRATERGFVMRGDNNSRDDAEPVGFPSIVGRVVFASRGAGKRRVRGGFAGLLLHLALRLRRLCLNLFRKPLHALYRALSGSGWLARFLPRRFAPRVVSFRDRDRQVLRLLIGRTVVGEYDPRRGAWVIRKPYRLVVDERRLPTL
jgi:hypothetical protein